MIECVKKFTRVVSCVLNSIMKSLYIQDLSHYVKRHFSFFFFLENMVTLVSAQPHSTQSIVVFCLFFWRISHCKYLDNPHKSFYSKDKYLVAFEIVSWFYRVVFIIPKPLEHMLFAMRFFAIIFFSIFCAQYSFCCFNDIFMCGSMYEGV